MLSPRLFALVSCTSLAIAQWHAVQPTPAPHPISAHGLVFSIANGESVLFGGNNSVGLSSDTWTFDGAAWTQRTPPLSPPARIGGCMAYDLLRGVVVLYGGATNGFGINPLDDTWEWNGTTWNPVQVPASPGGRYLHVMCYDLLRGRTVLWGGNFGVGGIGNSTWEYDGATWTQVMTATQPNPVTECAMEFYPPQGRAYLVGGRNAALQDLAEVWYYDGNNWNQQTLAVLPPGRNRACMAYDWRRNALVLFGGRFGLLQQRGDTWMFDGASWRPADGPQPRPSDRSLAAMTFDLSRGQIVLVGGSGWQTPTSETWLYGPSAQPFGAGCPGSAGIPTWQCPPPESGQTLVATLTNLGPAATGLGLLAFQRSPNPIDLSAIGMPGCNLYAVPRDLLPLPTSSGSAVLTLPIPADPVLRGAVFYLQGASLEPVNPFGAVLSAPLRLQIGL